MFNPAALLLVLFTGTALSAATAAIPLPPPAPARTGSYETDLKDPETGVFLTHYAVCAPNRLPPGNTLGLVIGFHGSGGEAAGTANHWASVLQRNKVADNYVVIASKSQGGYHTKSDDAATTKLIDWALATYPIDKRRVYAMGFSAGGWYAADFGTEHQERFAAISMYGAGMHGRARPMKNAEEAPPIYLVVGTEDGAAKGEAYSAREKLSKLGFRFVFREIAGMGHDVGPEMVVDDNIRWMLQQRSNLQPPIPEQQPVLREASNVKKAPAMWMNPVQAAQLAFIGGMHVGAVAEKVATNENEAVRLAVAKLSSEAWLGPAHLDVLIGYLRDKSGKVRHAAIKAIANQASWNWTEAKQALVAVASTKKFEREDRLLAIGCLGYAAKFITLCDRWDDRVIMPGLALLLNDPSPEIRAAVAAILLPTKKDGAFGYDPAGGTAAARAASTVQWCEWVDARCAGWKDFPVTSLRQGDKPK